MRFSSLSANTSKTSFEIDEEQQKLVQPFSAAHAPSRSTPASSKGQRGGDMQMQPLGSGTSASGSMRPGMSRSTSDSGTPMLERQVKDMLNAGPGSSAASSSTGRPIERRIVQEDDGGAVETEFVPPAYRPEWSNVRGEVS